MSRLLAAPILLLAGLSAPAATPAFAQTQSDEARFRAAQERFDREYEIYREAVDRYVATRGPVRGRAPDYRPDYRQAPAPDYRNDAPLPDDRDEQPLPAERDGPYRRAPDISGGRADL
jgi:hypothetical protein